MKKIIQFFRDSFAELRKVVWPSREEVADNTRVVIVSVVIFAVVLGLVDLGLFVLVDRLF